jgi:hypothetical protein
LVGSRPKVTTEYKGFTFEGSLDDVWLDQNQTGYVVDYKATAKKDPVIALDLTTPHHQSYVNQVAFYVWLLRQGGHNISDTCYFVYATGDNTRPAFEDTMRFRTHLIAHQVECSWVVTISRIPLRPMKSVPCVPMSSSTIICAWFLIRFFKPPHHV